MTDEDEKELENCPHVWKLVCQGGAPDDPGANETVACCEICGIEREAWLDYLVRKGK